MEEEMKLGMKDGVVAGTGRSASCGVGHLVGVVIEVEQQEQIQKGEQASSPQSLECCAWSVKC